LSQKRPLRSSLALQSAELVDDCELGPGHALPLHVSHDRDDVYVPWKSIYSGSSKAQGGDDRRPALCASIEHAAERKPWPVISSLPKPSRRKAALMAFSLMWRSRNRAEGNRYLPLPVIAWSSRNTAVARAASGSRCGRRISCARRGSTICRPQDRSPTIQRRGARRGGRRSARERDANERSRTAPDVIFGIYV
jgi:hypothetical protein